MLVTLGWCRWVEGNVESLANECLDLVAHGDEGFTVDMIGVYERYVATIWIALVVISDGTVVNFQTVEPVTCFFVGVDPDAWLVRMLNRVVIVRRARVGGDDSEVEIIRPHLQQPILGFLDRLR